MAGDFGCRWRLPAAASTNRGSALMLPVPVQPPSTSLKLTALLLGECLASRGESKISAPERAVSPHRMQLVSVGELTPLYRPLPRAAELPLKVTLVSVGELKELFMPPPWEAAELPLKVTLVSVGEE